MSPVSREAARKAEEARFIPLELVKESGSVLGWGTGGLSCD